jgi:DNA-binding IclR family transcriptional regulator
MGFVERTRDGRSYRLGLAILRLGFDYLGSQDMVELGRPLLESLRDETGYAASLVVRDGRDVIYLGGVGVWNMRAIWGNPIRIPPAATAGDVHNTLIIDFDACFDWGDSVRFDVDTDMVG